MEKLKGDQFDAGIFIPERMEKNPGDIVNLNYNWPKSNEVKMHPSTMKEKFTRNQWIAISHGGKTIYRIVKGATPKGLPGEFIWIDYDSRLELGLSEDFEGKLVLKRCDFKERWLYAPWFTPEPLQRAQFRMGFIVSLISLFVSLVSLLIALL